jgi:uncharacterized protein
MALEIVWWIVAILCFVLSFVALIKPVLPGLPLFLAGIAAYYFGVNKEELTISFWIILAIFSAVIFFAEILANRYFLKKYGSTKWGERVGCLSLIAGSFILPPFGLIFVPFISVFVAEKVQGKDNKEAAKVAWGTVVSFLSSSLAKAILQLIMLVIFVLYITL